MTYNIDVKLNFGNHHFSDGNGYKVFRTSYFEGLGVLYLPCNAHMLLFTKFFFPKYDNEGEGASALVCRWDFSVDISSDAAGRSLKHK